MSAQPFFIFFMTPLFILGGIALLFKDKTDK